MSKRIVVIGAGFAGMWSALASARLLDEAGRPNVQIVVIAPQPELHVRPRLYEQNPGAMKAPLQEVFEAVGVMFMQGSVEGIDVYAREVELVGVGADTTRRTLGYDRLILATGSRLHRPHLPGLDHHTFNVDQIADAARLDAHIASLASRAQSRARNTLVVAGGGFTGIETAAEMPARLRKVLGATSDVNVILVERNGEIGPNLGAGPRPIIARALTELGVKMRLGAGIASFDADGVVLESGERIDAATVIWTGGARASELTAQIPAERDAFGRLYVDRNLKVKGVEAVFATGDVACAVTDDAGNQTMMSCQHAQNMGRSAGYNATADLLERSPIPYSQAKYVTCLDLGPWGAVYTEGWDRQVKLEGSEAKALKTRINTEWIYPPAANRADALAAADPLRVVVA